LKRWLKPRGGDISNLVPLAKVYNLSLEGSGYIERLDAYLIGEAVRTLGAGRYRKEDLIDPNVGIILKKKVGDYIEKGETILEIYYNSKETLKKAMELLRKAISINKDEVRKRTLIYSVYS